MGVRVTLSLDEDLVAEIQKMADCNGLSFEETVSDSLRLFLRSFPARVPPSPFEVRAKALQARPGIDFDDIEELLEQAEGPAHR